VFFQLNFFAIFGFEKPGSGFAKSLDPDPDSLKLFKT
jgi:hypothetical protein